MSQPTQKASKLAISSIILALMAIPNLPLAILKLTTPGTIVRQYYVLPLMFRLIIFVFYLHPGMYLLVLLSIIFGIVALIKIHNNPNLKGKNLALIGSILGGVMMLSCLFRSFLIGV